MSRLEQIVARWLFRRVLTQPAHDLALTSLFSILKRVCDEIFYEDNVPTRDDFLLEMFSKATGSTK